MKQNRITSAGHSGNTIVSSRYCDSREICSVGDIWFWNEGVINGQQFNKAIGLVIEKGGKILCEQYLYWNMGDKEWHKVHWLTDVENMIDAGFKVIGKFSDNPELLELPVNGY